MTQSPKKYVCNFTSSTTNRGVEAKEIEIANTRLDIRASSRSAAAAAAPPAVRSPPVPRSPPPPRTSPAPRSPNDSASYIQVEVRRARRGVRLPAASSPACPAPAPPPTAPAVLTTCQRTEDAMDATGATGAGEVVMMPAMLACAGASARWPSAPAQGGGYSTRGDPAAAGDATRPATDKDDNSEEKNQGISVWTKYGECGDGNFNDDNSEEDGRPERVEVYYFERGAGAWLATGDAARETAVERAAQHVGRRARAMLEEALAVPRLAVGAPLAALVAVERTLLLQARGAVAGAVQTAADYALKPALALLFNAVLHPPLVFTGNVLRALRASLRPLWAALGDAVDPLVRLLASARLVSVTVDRRCTCNHTV